MDDEGENEYRGDDGEPHEEGVELFDGGERSLLEVIRDRMLLLLRCRFGWQRRNLEDRLRTVLRHLPGARHLKGRSSCVLRSCLITGEALHRIVIRCSMHLLFQFRHLGAPEFLFALAVHITVAVEAVTVVVAAVIVHR